VFQRFSRLTLAAAILAVPVGLVGAVQAGAASGGTSATVGAKPNASLTALAVRDCGNADQNDIGYQDKGASVKRAQCELNWALSPYTGHTPLDEDGDFGSKTRTAVRQFQTCANTHGAGLAVDGRVGAHTWPKLDDWARSNSYVC